MNTIEFKTAKSTKTTFILPRITVWLQVRVLPDPPAFAREVSEGCRDDWAANPEFT
jgi:hypothetical protein